MATMCSPAASWGLVVVDAVGRLCEGVLADESCYMDESHYNGLLEYPHYTRPPVWHGREVPEVLQNGNHARSEPVRRESTLETPCASVRICSGQRR